MHGGFKKPDPDELLELIKRAMRLHQADDEIREQTAKAGLARDAFMQRMIDGLIAKARNPHPRPRQCSSGRRVAADQVHRHARLG